MAKTIQDQLAEKIKAKFPTAEVKKINRDNYVDIHLPFVHPKRGTHLGFNTASGTIKLVFYCREEEFTQQVIAKSGNLEAYSQGVRPKGNPMFKTVDAASTAAFAFIENLSGEATQKQAATGEETPKPKKEKPATTTSKGIDLPDFDLTEFDLDGEPTSKTPTSNLPKGKPADLSQFDEPDRCLDDPMAFLTCIQLLRNYYLGLSPRSNTFRGQYEEILQEFTKAAVVSRISNTMLRLAHEDGNLIESLLLGPMLQAEESYDKNYDTHDDYVRDLGTVVSDLLSSCNGGLYLDTLEFFMYLGDMLDEEDAPNGSLTVQDRYFPLFLMLKASPDQDLDNLEMVLNKGAKSRNATSGFDVKSLVIKASGNYGQLSNEEKLGLVLYDFILWDEKPGLDIKLGDIAAAKSIFILVTQNAALGEELVGGFNDNASYEIFQFFNVEFNREGFHTFCLERWKELTSEWNPLKIQLLLDRVKRDFHISTYTQNPVLKDYLEVFGGVQVVGLEADTRMTKEEKKDMVEDGPFILNENNKALYISSMPHCILFVLLQVGAKLDKFTDEEITDIQSTAITMGEWFDMDQDECLEALDDTLNLLKQCKNVFGKNEMETLVFENCIAINTNVSNEAVREDIIRYMNDLAKADGKFTTVEKENLDYYATLIRIGASLFDKE